MKTVNPVGRPCGYTKEIGEEICRRIEAGETLLTICDDPHMPHRSTVYDWTQRNVDQEFTDSIARAREVYNERKFDQMSQRADALLTTEGVTAVHVSAVKLAFEIEAYRLGQLDRKKFGKDAVPASTVDIRNYFMQDDEAILERYAAKVLAQRERLKTVEGVIENE